VLGTPRLHERPLKGNARGANLGRFEELMGANMSVPKRRAQDNRQSCRHTTAQPKSTADAALRRPLEHESDPLEGSKRRPPPADRYAGRVTAALLRVGQHFNPYRLFHGSFVPEPIEKLKTEHLSQGAKLAYGRLMRYAGKDGACFPSESALGTTLGVSEKQARNYISDLTAKGFITKLQRGLKQTNRYTFILHPCLAKWLEEKGEKGRVRDRKNGGGQERKALAHKENQGKENQAEESHIDSSINRSVPAERDGQNTPNTNPARVPARRSIRFRDRAIDHPPALPPPLPWDAVRSPHSAVAAIQDELFRASGEHLGYPDEEIAERVLKAGLGAPSERVCAIVRKYAKGVQVGKKPIPRSYGLFLTHIGRYFEGHPNARRPFQLECSRKRRTW